MGNPFTETGEEKVARESWIAVQADLRKDLSEITRHYGFSPLDQREVDNAPQPWNAAAREEAPDGTVGFYVYYDGRWTLIYDPWLILWEAASIHAWVSERFAALVLTGVFKPSADAFGYGEFEHGDMRRWVFRQQHVVTQDTGNPAPWEQEIFTGEVGDMGPRLRKHWGIYPERAEEVISIFAAIPGMRQRRSWFPWLPWRRRAERRIGTQTY